ncbi:VCBS repeat-containing protein [Snuella lapsa]|uniref:VCBS repeat-containing protein n=1 Tax=Snuella lapsa TaxID=870481 RepID=A0ABP6YM10_9FLAO
MIKKMFLLCLVYISFGYINTSSSKFEQENSINNSNPNLLEVLDSKKTGITFQNKIQETVKLNYFNFMHLYMGAGLATADFNNDGLQDIYFVSNLFQDKLYINKGNLKFEDISQQTGISKPEDCFSTGVTVVDINSDGFMDIYLCRSGSFKTGDSKLTNQLFINNGDLTFTEKAKDYGLDDRSHSTQALFLDYDLDGDLDLYLVNTPVDFRFTSAIAPREKVAIDPRTSGFGSSDKLYKNENGFYVDVSLKSGMKPEISFGLNAIICDINNDGYPDIHVSNDFVGPDFLYENQKNGTFKEVALDRLKHTSYYSMGSDITDINNDGNLDLMVLDMSFKDYKESKTSMSMSNREDFKNMLKSDYNYQYMHNMLHLGDGIGGFSEVSQLAGLSKTDWSWSPLFVDFDNDGLKDVYVTNGIKHNVLDVDGQAKQNVEMRKYRESGNKITQEEIDYLMGLLPESKKTNYIFRNTNGLQFNLKNNIWLSENPGITHGASYADFDNDGDLDIVMNNTNESAKILRNLASDKQVANAIIIELENTKTKNYFGIGAIVELEANGITQKQYITSNRGYFSASQCVAHFGLGQAKVVDRITVTWPNGEKQVVKRKKANKKLVIKYKPNIKLQESNPNNTLFTNEKEKLSRVYHHRDIYTDDYKTQVLIPHRLSSYGPKLIKGDLDNNGLNDVFITSGYLQESGMYYNTESGFRGSMLNGINTLEKEETCGAIADFNNDGYNDIYVGCGSYQFNKTYEVKDYLLFGSANNIFVDVSSNIPEINTNTSKVLPFDYDGDGDLDLFIGSRVVSGAYPLSPKNYILQNNNGKFTDVTHKIAPEIEFFGMVTDADWKLENNRVQLAIVGEWTGIGLFEYDGTKFKEQSTSISTKFGWWNSIKFEDLDNDGDKDIIAGNLGLNYKFHASEEKPFQLYYGDLDKNGTQEIILAKDVDGSIVPVRGKECSTEQMPIISEKFPSFNEFANQDLFGIYGKDLENTKKYKATMFETTVFLNNGNDYKPRVLPLEAQFSTVNSIVTTDLNEDGYIDLILAGNMYESEIETTKADAGKGVILINDGKANFTVIPNSDTGFIAEHNVKDLKLIKGTKKDYVFVGNNNKAIQLFSINK